MTAGTAIVVRNALWPIAILVAVYRVFVLAWNGDPITNDFRPVYQAIRAFRADQAVYTADFRSVDPHYLYAPNGTLLLSPFAYFDEETARALFVTANTIGILIALWLLLRMFGHGLSSVAAPALLLGVFASESVIKTLTFGNINGLILLGEVAFMFLFLRRRDLWAGVPLGLTIAIKPILAPLLLLPLLRGRWKPLVWSAAIPLVTLGIAWGIAADPGDYLTRTAPYLSHVRDHYNSSLAGQGVYFGIPDILVLLARALTLVAVAAALYLLWKRREEDELTWLTVSSGVLLLGVFLVGSLGQMYYSILLIPMLFSVVREGSPVRVWTMWAAVYLFMSVDNWRAFDEWGFDGWMIETLRPTLGWLIAIGTVVGVMLWREAERRPQEGPAKAAPAVDASAAARRDEDGSS